jgi:hypothetical protein
VLALTATDGLNFGENKSTAVAGCVNTFHSLKGKISLAKKTGFTWGGETSEF